MQKIFQLSFVLALLTLLATASAVAKQKCRNCGRKGVVGKLGSTLSKISRRKKAPTGCLGKEKYLTSKNVVKTCICVNNTKFTGRDNFSRARDYIRLVKRIEKTGINRVPVKRKKLFCAEKPIAKRSKLFLRKLIDLEELYYRADRFKVAKTCDPKRIFRKSKCYSGRDGSRREAYQIFQVANRHMDFIQKRRTSRGKYKHDINKPRPKQMKKFKEFDKFATFVDKKEKGKRLNKISPRKVRKYFTQFSKTQKITNIEEFKRMFLEREVNKRMRVRNLEKRIQKICARKVRRKQRAGKNIRAEAEKCRMKRMARIRKILVRRILAKKTGKGLGKNRKDVVRRMKQDRFKGNHIFGHVIFDRRERNGEVRKTGLDFIRRYLKAKAGLSPKKRNSVHELYRLYVRSRRESISREASNQCGVIRKMISRSCDYLPKRYNRAKEGKRYSFKDDYSPFDFDLMSEITPRSKALKFQCTNLKAVSEMCTKSKDRAGKRSKYCASFREICGTRRGIACSKYIRTLATSKFRMSSELKTYFKNKGYRFYKSGKLTEKKKDHLCKLDPKQKGKFVKHYQRWIKRLKRRGERFNNRAPGTYMPPPETPDGTQPKSGGTGKSPGKNELDDDIDAALDELIKSTSDLKGPLSGGASVSGEGSTLVTDPITAELQKMEDSDDDDDDDTLAPLGGVTGGGVLSDPLGTGPGPATMAPKVKDGKAGKKGISKKGPKSVLEKLKERERKLLAKERDLERKKREYKSKLEGAELKRQIADLAKQLKETQSELKKVRGSIKGKSTGGVVAPPASIVKPAPVVTPKDSYGPSRSVGPTTLYGGRGKGGNLSGRRGVKGGSGGPAGGGYVAGGQDATIVLTLKKSYPKAGQKIIPYNNFMKSNFKHNSEIVFVRMKDGLIAVYKKTGKVGKDGKPIYEIVEKRDKNGKVIKVDKVKEAQKKKKEELRKKKELEQRKARAARYRNAIKAMKKGLEKDGPK